VESLVSAFDNYIASPYIGWEYNSNCSKKY